MHGTTRFVTSDFCIFPHLECRATLCGKRDSLMDTGILPHLHQRPRLGVEGDRPTQLLRPFVRETISNV